MKESELRESAECCLCSKRIGESGLPLFFRVTVESYVLKADALQRQSGMESLVGSVALAQIMGPGEDLAKKINSSQKTVCFDCSQKNDSLVILLND